MLHYFAFGSNMSSRRLVARVPSAVAVGVARLPGHRLKFHKPALDGSGKCDVVSTGSPDDGAWGVVFRVDPQEVPRLDKFEGLGKSYEKQEGALVRAAGGEEWQVFYYTALKRDPAAVPHTWYRDHVLYGAREHGLPTEYIKQIEKVAASVDPDQEREAKERLTYLDRFMFVRHCHYDKAGKSQNERIREPLSERGRWQAERAASFIQEQGLIPDLVVTTKTERTKETAEIIMGQVKQSTEPLQAPGGFRNRQDMNQKIAQWLANGPMPPRTVLFVGHNTSQHVCNALLKEAVGSEQMGDRNQWRHGSVLSFTPAPKGRWKLLCKLPTALPRESGI